MDKEITRKLHEERSYSLLTKDFPFVSTSTPMSQETEMVVYPRKHSAQCAMGLKCALETDQEEMSPA